MNEYPTYVKHCLLAAISQMTARKDEFVKQPGRDFSRNRKISLDHLVFFLVGAEASTMQFELQKFSFLFPESLSGLPSCSAMFQRRSKLSRDAMPAVFAGFNKQFPTKLTNGLHLLAVDGTQINIAYDLKDRENHHFSHQWYVRGYNDLHMVALQDLGTQKYLDAIIQNGTEKNEHAALCELVQRSSLPLEKTVLAADRGFASFNFFLHAEQVGCHYVVRANDAYVRNLLGSASLPDALDTHIKLYLTRSRATGFRKHPEHPELYRVISSRTTFDFIEPGAQEEIPVSLRIVRFQLKDGIFENIITNLSLEEFPPERLKWIYRKRWGIETSFRNLKCILALEQFRSKKPEHILQEIWARLILYNFCMEIVSHAKLPEKIRKHPHKIDIANVPLFLAAPSRP
ncbi:MAG: IS4 family transposase [Selenomonadaceae bacterium]|nr:IS4 family transposase [Selenomonadaceae bacterium]